MTARFGSLSASGQVVVTDAQVKELRLEPETLMLPAGLTRRVTVTALLTDGSRQNVTGLAEVTVVPSEIGSWSEAGGVTALKIGEGIVRATFQGKVAQASLVVAPALLERIEIGPESPTVPNGLSTQLTATGFYSDGSTEELAEFVSWESLSPDVCTVGVGGVATGHSLGSAEIEATLGDITGETTLVVTEATLERLSLTPDTDLPIGLTQQLSLVAYYSDGSSAEVTSEATFSSSNPSFVSVTTLEPRGVLEAHSLGTASITGSYAGAEASALVTAIPAILQSIRIVPGSPTIKVGDSLRFQAHGIKSDGSESGITNLVTWSLDNPSSASLSDTSVVTGLALGQVIVRAEYQDIRGEVELTIEALNYLNRLWLGSTRSTGIALESLWILKPDDLRVETPGGLPALPPDAFSAFDSERNRVYLASRYGLNVLDGMTGEHLGGSPFHSGGFTIGSEIFPRTWNRRGFRLYEVAYDAQRARIYLATSHGLQVMDANTLTKLNEDPIPASDDDFATLGVSYSAARGEVYLLTPESKEVSGDNNAIAIFDADTLSPVEGSPFIPPGNQTLMYSQMALDEKRSRLYSTSINTFTEFNTESRTFTTRNRQSSSGGGVSEAGQIYIAEEDVLAMVDFNRDKLELYDGESLSPLEFSPIALTGTPRAVAYDAESRRVLVTTSIGLEIFDITTGDEATDSPFQGVAIPNFWGFTGILRVP